MIRRAMLELQNWKLSRYRKPLIILGARQVGKTYLAKEFGAKEFRSTHAFNFELEPDCSCNTHYSHLAKTLVDDVCGAKL